jgi:aspartate dehydrogenase
LKIALVGNGAIARLLTDFCAARPDRFSIVGALGLHADKVSVGDHPVVYSIDALLALTPDLVVECAGHSAVRAVCGPVMAAGIDLVIVSTGSLADQTLWDEVSAASARGAAKVKLVAGALPGVDALAAAKLAGLTSVTLTSRKPPHAWKGTPAETTHDLDKIAAATVLYAGNARDAALRFPKNANVAATAALAGIGFEKTRVMLVADPAVTQNVHHLEATGAFGAMSLEIHANPSPDNPKTSHMAALSIMRVLENEAAAIVI